MTVYFSLFSWAGSQFFDNNGVPLAGGLLYTYAAGTSTPQTTYTSSSGLVANSNPIVLDAAGRQPYEIWLSQSTTYKFVLKDSLGNLIGTYDDIGGASDYSGIYANFASTSDITKGDALVGFKQSNSSGILGGAVGRTVHQKLQEVISVKDFGAAGNGTTNDATAFTTASAATSGFIVPAGSYSIQSSISISADVQMQPGAILLIPNGVTVAFTGNFIADVSHVFTCTGTGKVTFDWTKTNTGYPEWWGATTGGADCSTAINAAIKALQTTQLQCGDYFVASTIKMVYEHRTLKGKGSQYNDTTNEVTRIIMNGGSNHIIQVGPDSKPAPVGGSYANALYKQIIVQDLYVARDTVPVVSSDCCGVRLQFVIYAQVNNVKSAENIYNFYFTGTIGCFVNNCYSKRVGTGSGGTDKWYGYYVYGFEDIGLAGSNASLYLNYCQAECNNAGLNASGGIGFYADGAFTDLFMESPETVYCETGIAILGNGSTSLPATNTDLQIKNPVVDAFFKYGIYLYNINQFGSVDIHDGYYGAGATAVACILADTCPGSIRVAGGQMPMLFGTSAQGVSLSACKGFVVDRVQILESSLTGASLSNCVSCDIRPIVKNYTNTLATAAVQLLTTNSYCYVQPALYGASGKAALGVQLVGTTNGNNEINCTLMSPSCITGGSANKLVINGVQITTTGLSGTNLVSGVMT